MKRQKTDIKKTIKKRIELRHSKLAFIKKRNVMNERDRKRIEPSKFVPVRVELVSRNDRRCGNYDTSSTIEYLPILENKEPVSIIITAYKTQDYIEECLDSIENQTYFINNDNYEVLVGVDACQETLNKLLEIRHKYRNLRILMMNSNMGTYVTSNTLIDVAKYENIIRFDGDDIMIAHMINEIMYHIDFNNVIRFKYSPKYSGEPQKMKLIDYPHGVGLFKKTLYDELGGYKPWMCAADTELLRRGLPLIKQKQINKPLFYRRMHDDSLTQNSEFGKNSEKRRQYKAMIGKHRKIKIKKIVNKYVEY